MNEKDPAISIELEGTRHILRLYDYRGSDDRTLRAAIGMTVNQAWREATEGALDALAGLGGLGHELARAVIARVGGERLAGPPAHDAEHVGLGVRHAAGELDWLREKGFREAGVGDPLMTATI